jgi:probable rRNA maturation factor
MSGIPSESDMTAWLSLTVGEVGPQHDNGSEVSIRIVGESESREMNLNYRRKDSATNVLAFPSGLPEIEDWPEDTPVPLGDLVICAPVVEREATEQGKDLAHHWGHMLVHGTLHLLGYDHQTDAQAQKMESIEAKILDSGGVPNPYEDD